MYEAEIRAAHPDENDDVLRDLSIEDAQELRAFQEKRRWFEGKLKLLEDLPPVYPFILPVLVPSAVDTLTFTYAEAEQSPYRLPSGDELRSWQSERDALEEEVLAFDGGGLGRMKAKTREVTLIPLTKPSTHLVAITLDLILIVDRLLTLLRRRCDILELVGLRLKWDELRWKVMLETKRIKEDVRHYLQEEGKWKIAESSRREMGETGLATPVKRVASEEKPNDATSSGSGSVTPAKTVREFSPPRTPSSPLSVFSSQTSSPRLSSSTQSTLQSLSARHRTLISTLLKRSSALLDRMIDLAGPLKGLGDIRGPVDGEQGDSGALPDELLDVQDDLDASCEDLRGRLTWCKQLEEHKIQAERYHVAVLRARSSADEVISHLRGSLSRPATSEQHQILASLLHDAKVRLPAPIDHTLPRPVYSDYSDIEIDSQEMIGTLKEYTKAAKNRCELSEDGVGWYARISAARERMEDEDARLAGRVSDATALAAELRRPREMPGSENQDERPETNESTGTADEEDWLNRAPEWIFQLEQLITSLTTQAHRSEAAIIAYKSAFLNIPIGLRPELHDLGFPDDLHIAAADRSESALTLARNAEDVMKQAKEDLEVMPLVRGLQRDLEVLVRDVRALKIDLGKAIDQAAWRPESLHGESREQRDDGEDGIEDIRRRLKTINELYHRVQTTRARLGDCSSGKRVTMLGFLDMGETLDTDIESCTGLLDLFERVRNQKRTVHIIEQEANELLDVINRSRPSGTSPGTQEGRSSVEPMDMSAIVERAKHWSDGLASRLHFVSPGDPEQRAGEDGVTISKSLENGSYHRTVPAIESRSSYKTDLRHLDLSVRQRVNELSSRVQTAAAWSMQEHQSRISAHATISDPATEHEREPDVFGSRSMTQFAQTSQPDRSGGDNTLMHIRQLRQRIKSLRLADLAFPSSSAIIQTPSLRRLPEAAAVKVIRDTLSAIDHECDEMWSSRDLGEGGVEEEAQFTRLKDELDKAKAFLPRLDALAFFSDRARVCDEVFGQMMEHLDNLAPSSSREGGTSDRVLLEARRSFDAVEEASLAVETDRRVLADLRRLRAIWSDLCASFKADDTEFEHGDQDQDDTASIVSSAQSTIASSTISRIPVARQRIPSSISIRSNLSSSTAGNGTRATSNPFPRLGAFTESSRNRTISSSTSRNRLDSMSDKSRLSLSVSSSTSSRTLAGTLSGMNTPRTSVGGGSGEKGSTSASSRIPRLSMLSTKDSSRSLINTLEPRTWKSSLPLPVPSMRNKSRISDTKPYISDPKSTLDQAVGKIVNNLKMDVPVVPVNLAGTDDWKDQSGRYWIGSKGRAKLCFCRILRSRTVMVRVGGGWVELSRFLLDHFADSLWQVPSDLGHTAETTPITPSRNVPIVPVAPTPAVADDEATPSPERDVPPSVRPTASAARQSAAPITPVRPKQAVTRSTSGHSIVSLSRSSSYFSPTNTNGAGEGESGPSSPLVPLHFIRKASESPPVSEREKERLGVGRRSILGREG